MRVLGLCGSLRSDSYNLRLLEAARPALPNGATLEIFEGLGELAAYNEDLTESETPGMVSVLRAAISDADAVLIATPEYNHSIPGFLKNALDWASRPFPDNALRDKPAAVVGASTGLFGAVWAQAETRKVLTAIGAEVLDVELPVGQAHHAFSEGGGLIDADLQSTLVRLVDQLLESASPRACQPA